MVSIRLILVTIAASDSKDTVELENPHAIDLRNPDTLDAILDCSEAPAAAVFADKEHAVQDEEDFGNEEELYSDTKYDFYLNDPTIDYCLGFDSEANKLADLSD